MQENITAYEELTHLVEVHNKVSKIGNTLCSDFMFPTGEALQSYHKNGFGIDNRPIDYEKDSFKQCDCVAWRGFAKRYELRNIFNPDFMAIASDDEIQAMMKAVLSSDTKLILREFIRRTLIPSVDGPWNGKDFEDTPIGYQAILNPPSYQAKTFDSTHTHYKVFRDICIGNEINKIANDIYEHFPVISFPRLYVFCNRRTKKHVFEDQPNYELRVQDDMVKIEFITTEEMPPDYVIYLAVPLAEKNKPVAFIEPDNVSFRGLHFYVGTNKERKTFRIFGIKYFNRSAAVVVQYKLEGEYIPPVDDVRTLY